MSEAEVKEESAVDVIAVKDGLYDPKNKTELGQLISTIAKGGGFPDCFDTHEKRIAAYNLARGLMGEQWQLALNNLYYIKGKLNIFGDLPRAIAERSGQIQEFKLFVIDKDYKEICTANKNLEQEPWAGVCIVQRKGRDKKEYSYSIEEAETAGQLPAGPQSPWSKYRKIMLIRKAQALGIKFEFSDSLLGVDIAEHIHEFAPDLVPIKNVYQPTAADDLNSTFAKDVTQ